MKMIRIELIFKPNLKLSIKQGHLSFLFGRLLTSLLISDSNFFQKAFVKSLKKIDSQKVTKPPNLPRMHDFPFQSQVYETQATKS